MWIINEEMWDLFQVNISVRRNVDGFLRVAGIFKKGKQFIESKTSLWTHMAQIEDWGTHFKVSFKEVSEDTNPSSSSILLVSGYMQASLTNWALALGTEVAIKAVNNPSQRTNCLPGPHFSHLFQKRNNYGTSLDVEAPWNEQVLHHSLTFTVNSLLHILVLKLVFVQNLSKPKNYRLIYNSLIFSWYPSGSARLKL